MPPAPIVHLVALELASSPPSEVISLTTRLLIAGNWKMNTTIASAGALADAIKSGLNSIEDIDTVVCPPSISLTTVAERLTNSSISLGAQNVHYEISGAYTGEISPRMLVNVCEYVIIGHSERRHSFGETDDMIAEKVDTAVSIGLKPIVCVGETMGDREAGKAQEIVGNQVKDGLAKLGSLVDVSIAYEPVWAIGTGAAASDIDAQEMSSHIRQALLSLFGPDEAGSVRILYGGSVKAENVTAFVRQPDVDGALVGGASLEAEEFVELVRNATNA